MEHPKKHILLYCDGSCRPNPGYAGYGLFGYIFYYTEKKVSTKYPYDNNFHFTSKGILSKNENEKLVITDIIEVVSYLTSDKSTNNKAELLGFIKALQIAQEEDNIESVTIYTDSSYVATSYNENLSHWLKINWIRHDGREIIHKEDWRKIVEISDKLKEKNIAINVLWVKGHSDDIGNKTADFLSCIGSNAAIINLKNNNEKIDTTQESISILDKKTPYSEFCNTDSSKDVIYNFKDVLFNSNVTDDKTYCFLFNADKNVENIGTKNIDSIFAINMGYLPSVVNEIKHFYRSIPRINHRPCCIKVHKLKDPQISRLFSLIDIKYLLERINEKYSFTIVRDTTPFVFDVDQYSPMIVNVNKTFYDMLDIVTDSPLANYKIFKSSIYTLFYDEKGKLKITNKDKNFDITTYVNDKLEDTLKDRYVFLQKLIVEIGRDLPSYLTMKHLESVVKDLEVIIGINCDTNLMTCLFNFILPDRNLLITNITNKFVIKLLTKPSAIGE